VKNMFDETLFAAGIDPQSAIHLDASPADIKYLKLAHSKDPFNAWKILRNAVEQTGHWPVFIGNASSLETMRPMFSAAKSLDDVRSEIARGSAFDVTSWFDAYNSAGADESDGEDCEEREPIIITEADLTYGSRRSSSAELILLMIPTMCSWEVPSYLMIGRGNQLHDPYQHVGVQKMWFEKYRAELITVTNDMVEMAVHDPPQTLNEAFELAVQHCTYCPDLDDTLDHLAAERVNANFWSFWWD
jgi:hypothetical protein